MMGGLGTWGVTKRKEEHLVNGSAWPVSSFPPHTEGRSRGSIFPTGKFLSLNQSTWTEVHRRGPEARECWCWESPHHPHNLYSGFANKA